MLEFLPIRGYIDDYLEDIDYDSLGDFSGLQDHSITSYSFSDSVSSSSDKGMTFGLLITGLLLIIAIVLTYFFIYRYYRNRNKRFAFESETHAVMQNNVNNDSYIRSRHGLSSPGLPGSNNGSPLTRVNDPNGSSYS